MSIKLELYRVFKEVADSGSVSAAARSLYISQSAVSQTISQLEEQLGLRLFTRGTRGVTLTPEGKTLYQYVSSALSLIENGEQRLSLTKGLELGELIIGASDTITSCFLLPFLDSFHRQYPRILIKVLNGTIPEVMGLLRSGKVDIAFANLPINDSRITMRHCFDIQDIFVASAQYECDFDKTYTLEEIAEMPVIMLERKSNSRFFLRRGVSLAPAIELGSHDLVLALTKIGLGVSCVIREFATDELASGEMRELKTNPPLPPRSIGAFSPENVSLSAACARFLELVGCNEIKKESEL
ncbi:MAG: LysR family transcriptional regulator [Angelakisella sp.]